MLSRVAESIYWMNRYVERAENVARFIDANLQMILDLPMGEAEQWEPLVVTTGDRDLFFSLYDRPSREYVIQFLTFDPRNPNAIVSCLQAARENARSVREYISSEVWQAVNAFYLHVREAEPQRTALELPHEFFAEITTASHRFVGVTDCTMTHGEGWHFARLGRMLERADKTSRILDVKYYIILPSLSYVGSPYDNILWGALLRSASAFESYRKLHDRIAPRQIVEFLVLDNRFPRAIHHCLTKASRSLEEISGLPRNTFSNRCGQALGRLLSEFDYLQIDEVLGGGLHEFLDRTQGQLNTIDEAVHATYFRQSAHTVAEPATACDRGYLQ